MLFHFVFLCVSVSAGACLCPRVSVSVSVLVIASLCLSGVKNVCKLSGVNPSKRNECVNMCNRP